jgi:hypothetical protein
MSTALGGGQGGRAAEQRAGPDHAACCCATWRRPGRCRTVPTLWQAAGFLGMAVEMLLELPGGCGAGSDQFPARMTVKQNAANVMSAHKNY